MVFWVTPGVNADHMEVRDGRVCKVEKIAQSKYAKIPPQGDNLNNGLNKGKITGAMSVGRYRAAVS